MGLLNELKKGLKNVEIKGFDHPDAWVMKIGRTEKQEIHLHQHNHYGPEERKRIKKVEIVNEDD